MVVVRHRVHVIKKDIHTLILVRTVILQLHLRYAVAERVPELVINVVQLIINTLVQVRDIVEGAEQHVAVNIQHVTVQRIIHGAEVLVSVTVVSNMLVTVRGKQVRELLAEESIRLVYVQVIMFRFVM